MCKRESARARERPSGGRSEPCPAVLCFSSTKLSDTKGFCSCICFALRAVLKQSIPKRLKLLLVKLSIRHRTPLISFAKQVITHGSLTHGVFALRVHFSEAQVANRCKGICWVDHRLRRITAQTHNERPYIFGERTSPVYTHAAKVSDTHFIMLHSHNDLLFEERTIKGEGFIFTSFSTYMDSILLGELLRERKTFSL